MFQFNSYMKWKTTMATIAIVMKRTNISSIMKKISRFKRHLFWSFQNCQKDTKKSSAVFKLRIACEWLKQWLFMRDCKNSEQYLEAKCTWGTWFGRWRGNLVGTAGRRLWRWWWLRLASSSASGLGFLLLLMLRDATAVFPTLRRLVGLGWRGGRGNTGGLWLGLQKK